MCKKGVPQKWEPVFKCNLWGVQHPGRADDNTWQHAMTQHVTHAPRYSCRLTCTSCRAGCIRNTSKRCGAHAALGAASLKMCCVSARVDTPVCTLAAPGCCFSLHGPSPIPSSLLHAAAYLHNCIQPIPHDILALWRIDVLLYFSHESFHNHNQVWLNQSVLRSVCLSWLLNGPQGVTECDA